MTDLELSDKRFWEYCCKDSAVTFEIHERHMAILEGEQLAHYQSNVSNLEPMLFMEMTGIKYDMALAKSRRAELLRQLWIAQAKLDLLSGYRFQWQTKDEILNAAKTLMGFAKADIRDYDALVANCKKPFVEKAKRLRILMHLKEPNLATIGEIENLCAVGLNVDKDEFETFIYERLDLPIQYNEDPKTKEKRPTTDYEALLRLSKETKTNRYSPIAGLVIELAIEIRSLLRRAKMLSISCDGDGRVRCGYNIVGSYTGRVTSYTSPTGSGYNLQTIPNYTDTKAAPGGILGDRDLFIADEGYWFFQCDLKGADGWTVAAYCAMLGDPTMLEDYRYGLKPHNIMTLMLRGVKADYNNRDELLHLCSKKAGFDKDAWDVFACKRVFHGGNYLEGGTTIAKNILTDSEGKLWMSASECDHLKRTALFGRYPGLNRWHDWVDRKLKACPGIPYLIAASGQKCMFFNRMREILTKAVAFEPQANTTYATNQAMLRLWRDPENFIPIVGYENGAMRKMRRRIIPLHQVHDALCGQFRKEDTTWATGKIRSYFDNPLLIAGQLITIPFDGGYGPSWGNTKEGSI